MSNRDDANKPHDSREANKEATEKMAQNHDEQYAKFQQSQNKKTKSEQPDNEHMLENQNNIPDDALPIEQQNRNRFKDEKDDDFGVEQL